MRAWPGPRRWRCCARRSKRLGCPRFAAAGDCGGVGYFEYLEQEKGLLQLFQVGERLFDLGLFLCVGGRVLFGFLDHLWRAEAANLGLFRQK